MALAMAVSLETLRLRRIESLLLHWHGMVVSGDSHCATVWRWTLQSFAGLLAPTAAVFTQASWTHSTCERGSLTGQRVLTLETCIYKTHVEDMSTLLCEPCWPRGEGKEGGQQLGQRIVVEGQAEAWGPQI